VSAIWQRASTTQPEHSVRLPGEPNGDERGCGRVDGVAAEYRGHANDRCLAATSSFPRIRQT
jgi:hypothetical protein